MKESSKEKMRFVLVNLSLHGLESINSHILVMRTGKYLSRTGIFMKENFLVKSRMDKVSALTVMEIPMKERQETINIMVMVIINNEWL